MTGQQKKWAIRVVVLLVTGVLGVVAWQKFGSTDKNKGLVSGNGRIEAVEIDIAAKIAGRIKEIFSGKVSLSPPDRWWRSWIPRPWMPSLTRP